MTAEQEEKVMDLHTGKLYKIIKIENEIVVLEEADIGRRFFTSTTSLARLFTKVKQE